MAILTLDMSQLPAAARKKADEMFKNETMMHLALAKARQMRMAAEARRNPQRAINGLGGQTRHFDRFLWSAARRVCKPAPGEDQAVQEWLCKKHPDLFRVRHLPTKTQVGYGSTTMLVPSTSTTRTVRFTKTYAQS